jgi:hypothetical protein
MMPRSLIQYLLKKREDRISIAFSLFARLEITP